MGISFRNGLRGILPRWLSDRPETGLNVGFRFLWSIVLVVDENIEAALQAARARMPGLGTPTALPYIGRDRDIPRGFAESDAAYSARLIPWLDVAKQRGNARVMLDQLAGYLSGYAVRMRIVTDKGVWYTRETDGTFRRERPLTGAWDWDGDIEAQSRFWVILYPPVDLWVDDDVWGDDATSWGDGGTWGTTATPDQVEGVRAIVRRFMPPHAQCPWIIVSFDDDAFDPAHPFGAPVLPDGEWGHWGKDDVRQPARFDGARYWDGVT